MGATCFLAGFSPCSAERPRQGAQVAGCSQVPTLLWPFLRAGRVVGASLLCGEPSAASEVLGDKRSAGCPAGSPLSLGDAENGV